MLRLDDNKYFSKRFTYAVWLLMSFQAGYVNVGGFFISGNFVSHVTGTSSQIGMGLANLDLAVLITFLTVLMAYITGAAFSGHFIGRYKEENKDPKYTLVLTTKAILFGLVLYLSANEYHFLFMAQENVELVIIFFLSFCCGVQNATCSLSTNGFLKPTHMTGLSTDIGIGLAKLPSLKSFNKNKHSEEAGKTFLRINILLSFVFGGAISALIFSQNGHLGFLFPFISSLCFLCLGLVRDIKKLNNNGLVFNTAKSSILLTFLTTIFAGINSYLNI